MPLPDAQEAGANAVIPHAASGRRASETTQCASSSGGRDPVSDEQSARSARTTHSSPIASCGAGADERTVLSRAPAACDRTHRTKTHRRTHGGRRNDAHFGVSAGNRALASPLRFPGA
jgi:hypothetical protein